MSDWRVGLSPGFVMDIYDGQTLVAVARTPEQAQRVAALRNERDALRAACLTVKDYLNRLEGLPEDDPLLAMRRHFHAPLHKAIDAALEQPAAQSKETA